jgi:NADH-quinone oxidoreductase subunit C
MKKLCETKILEVKVNYKVTTAIAGDYVAKSINERIDCRAIFWNSTEVWVQNTDWIKIAQLLKDSPDLDFNYLSAITAVDYVEYFEVIYHLISFQFNQSAILKLRIFDRENPSVSSVTSIWQGADLQEREIWDLMGIRFDNHYNLKRILLWEEFPGHPLRKDFLR